MLRTAWHGTLGLLMGWTLIGTAFAEDITLEQLHRDASLSPYTIARYFSDFKFQFHKTVQAPEAFLAKRSGDCDDYAILAALLLKAKGYTPWLVSIRMKKEVHVVCYVEEARGYLDYNFRATENGFVRCGNELHEIGENVARSFGVEWLSVTEFVFQGGLKRLVRTTSPRAFPEAAAASGR